MIYRAKNDKVLFSKEFSKTIFNDLVQDNNITAYYRAVATLYAYINNMDNIEQTIYDKIKDFNDIMFEINRRNGGYVIKAPSHSSTIHIYYVIFPDYEKFNRYTIQFQYRDEDGYRIMLFLEFYVELNIIKIKKDYDTYTTKNANAKEVYNDLYRKINKDKLSNQELYRYIQKIPGMLYS